MSQTGNSWAVQEFSDVHLNDERLNSRFMKLAEDFSKHPQFSINQACEDWHSAKAAYRFFQNDKFTHLDLLKPHIKNTAQRCRNKKKILVLQDTTVIGYSDHPKTTGLGNIGGCSRAINEQQGLNMHAALAVTLDGLPLGLLSNVIWPRRESIKDEEDPGKPIDHLLPVEVKESYKWINAMEETYEAVKGEIQTITICDREADFFDLYLAAIDIKTDLVVRNNSDRNVGDRKTPLKLSEKLAQEPLLERIIIKIPVKRINKRDTKESQFREALIEIRSTRVTLTPSRKLSQVVKEQIQLSAVEAKEIDPPSGVEDAHWILLTTLPVETALDAKEIISFYAMRWKIESYFKILKSGCNVEKCRLSDRSRLQKYIALFSVIAWRIFWMTFVKRLSPEEPCEVALTENEWKTLFCVISKTKVIPEKPPPIKVALVWMARLGGFLARKNDGEPGSTYLWRGWSRLQDMASLREIIA